MNNDSEPTELPAIGDEVLVNIKPSVKSDRRWIQVGKLLATRREKFGLTTRSIEITGTLTAEENRGWETSSTWTGCVVAAFFDKYSNRWQATVPISEHAKSLWAKVWETDALDRPRTTEV